MTTAATPIIVNVDNYLRAATSAQFAGIERMARGINTFTHGKRPARIDRQTVERMNRDTIYSSALVDISNGASLTLPDAGDRYFSATVLNEDNYTTAIWHEPGTYTLTTEDHETDYVVVLIRILADETSEDDLAAVRALQAQIQLTASSDRPFERPDYDDTTLQETHVLLQKLGAGLAEAAGSNGTKDEVDPVRHLVSAAFGWGGLPEYEVVYQLRTAPLPVSDYELTVRDVPVDGFWSISVYNAAGYFEENGHDSYSINNLIAEPNADGSVTVHFGPEPQGHPNFLHIMDGWNYVVRLYQPHEVVRAGNWQFPLPEVVS